MWVESQPWFFLYSVQQITFSFQNTLFIHVIAKEQPQTVSLTPVISPLNGLTLWRAAETQVIAKKTLADEIHRQSCKSTVEKIVKLPMILFDHSCNGRRNPSCYLVYCSLLPHRMRRRYKHRELLAAGQVSRQLTSSLDAWFFIKLTPSSDAWIICLWLVRSIGSVHRWLTFRTRWQWLCNSAKHQTIG